MKGVKTAYMTVSGLSNLSSCDFGLEPGITLSYVLKETKQPLAHGGAR